MNILLVEDTPQKANRIEKTILQQFPQTKVEVKCSYQSGLDAIIKNEFDLILLDMTLPLYDYDKEPNDPLPKLGFDLFNEIKRRKISTSIIVISQFSTFTSKGEKEQTLEMLTQEMKKKFDNFIDSIFYAQNNTAWKTQLINHINNLNNHV